MKIVIGYAAMPTVDGTSVRYSGSTADPIPKAAVSIVDNNSSITFKPLQEVWIIDEHVLPNPTWNLLQGPSLLSTDTGFYSQTSSGGFSGTVSFAGAPPVTATVTNDPTVGFVYRVQDVQYGLVVPGVKYMLSGYITIAAPMNNAQSVLKMDFLDAGANVLTGLGASDVRSTTAGNAQQRVSMSAVAPANAASIRVSFGIQTTAAPTNSGTALFATLQLEPMWFPTTMSYPSPDCNPAQTTCIVLPNNTTIRQYRKFGGYVTHAIAGDYHGNVRTWHVDAVGYAWLFSLVYTANSFVNQFDSAIFGSLIASYFEGNASFPGKALFSTTNIVQGVQVANLQPNWDDLRSIVDGLAAQAGFFWTVDPYFNPLYEPPGYTQIPISLIADNSGNPDMVTTFPVYNFKQEMDFTQPGSAILVIGASSDSTSLNQALVKGTSYTTLTVQALPAAIAALTNGVASQLILGSNQVISLSALANVGATTLSVNSFTANADYGIGTQITWAGTVALVVDPAQTALLNQSLYGFGTMGSIFMRKVNDSSLLAVTDCTSRGIAELIQYDKERYIYHGMTNVELLVGQGIAVTSNTDGLNATTLLIQQVTAQWLGVDETFNDVWEYQADLGAVNRAASALMSHIFRRTTKNSSAPAINQQALVVLERFSTIDTAQYPYPLTVLADSPTAYYRLGEGSGATVLDSSGNNLTGSANGSMVLGVPGAITNDPNTAYLFDGTGCFIVLSSGANPNGWSVLTLEAWIKLSNISFSGLLRLFSNDNTASDNHGCELFMQAFGGGFTFLVGTGTVRMTLTTSYQFSAGVWYHIAATWNGSGGAFLYVNGVQVATGSIAGTIAVPSNLMSIGDAPATSSNFFPGTIDEPAIYQAQLSAARILKHYTVGITGKP